MRDKREFSTNFESIQSPEARPEILLDGLVGAVLVERVDQLVPEIRIEIIPGFFGHITNLSLDRVVKCHPNGKSELIGLYVEDFYSDLAGYRYDKTIGIVRAPSKLRMIGFGAYSKDDNQPEYIQADEFDQTFLDRLEETNRVVDLGDEVAVNYE